MQTKALKSDILISGGGPAGLTLACLLGRAGFDIVLLDAEKPTTENQTTRPSGRTAALLNSSLNILQAAGVWPDLKDNATALATMRIVDDSLASGETQSVEFKASHLDVSEFGYNIPNAILKQRLQQQIQGLENITYLQATKLSGYDIDGQQVMAATDHDHVIQADLIIGADGRGSVVRAVSGLQAKKHDYEQIAMTCLIEHTKPHNNTSTEFHRSGGPFTLVPMEGNSSSVVWVEKSEDAKRFLAMKRADFESAIQDRSRGLLGTITLKSDPESWPLMLLNSKGIVGKRAALAAEAVHVLSPIGAQGLNLSLRDVATLAETITDAARLGEDIGSGLVLKRYADRRKVDIQSHVIGIDGLNRVVANDFAAVKDLRRLGLRTLEAVPALKNYVMNQGLAPSMDQGRLVSGRPL